MAGSDAVTNFLNELKAAKLPPEEEAAYKRAFFVKMIAPSDEWQSGDNQWKRGMAATFGMPPATALPEPQDPWQRTREGIDRYATGFAPDPKGITIADIKRISQDPKASRDDLLAALISFAGEHGGKQAGNLFTYPTEVGGTKTALPVPGGVLWDTPVGMAQDAAVKLGAQRGGVAEGLTGMAAPIAPALGGILQRGAQMLPGVARSMTPSMPTFGAWAQALRRALSRAQQAAPRPPVVPPPAAPPMPAPVAGPSRALTPPATWAPGPQWSKPAPSIQDLLRPPGPID